MFKTTYEADVKPLFGIAPDLAFRQNFCAVVSALFDPPPIPGQKIQHNLKLRQQALIPGIVQDLPMWSNGHLSYKSRASKWIGVEGASLVHDLETKSQGIKHADARDSEGYKALRHLSPGRHGER